MTDFHNSKIKDHLIHKYIKEHTPESKNVHLNQRMYTRMYTWIKECTPELNCLFTELDTAVTPVVGNKLYK